MARRKLRDGENAVIEKMLLLCAGLLPAAGVRVSGYVHERQLERVAAIGAPPQENAEHQEAKWPPRRLKSTSN